VRYTRRFALGAIASAVLAGCGGGGGGADAAGGDPAQAASGGGGGPPSGSGGTGGDPAGQAFSAFGPVVVASGANSSFAPAVARLAGGGNVVLWVSGTEIQGRLTDAAGAPVGNVFVVNPGYTRTLGSVDVAPTTDGGFVVAWSLQTDLPNLQLFDVMAVQARRYDGSASPVWEARATGVFPSMGRVMIEPAGDGFLIGWTARMTASAQEEAWLGLLSASGSQVGDQVPVGVPGGSAADEVLGIAPLTDGTLVAVWRRHTFDPHRYTMYMRRFAADLNPLTSPIALPGFPATTAFPIDAEGLADGNVAIAWGTTGENSRPYVTTAVFTPDGAPISTVQSEVTELPPSDLQVLSFGNNGYGVGWQVVHGGRREISVSQFLWRFSLAGVPAGLPEGLGTRLTYWVSPTSGEYVDAGSGIDFAGGPDGHYVLAYHRATTQADTYLVGR
jgi:hypothetical protein